MRQLYLYPPNYAEIRRAFPQVRGRTVVYCYGEVIYNPQRWDMPPQTWAHEAVHSGQQGEDPAAWWGRYIEDQAFRLDQELPAHRAEYAYFRERMPAAGRLDDIGWELAAKLASPLYGSLLSVDEAKRLITNGEGA